MVEPIIQQTKLKMNKQLNDFQVKAIQKLYNDAFYLDIRRAPQISENFGTIELLRAGNMLGIDIPYSGPQITELEVYAGTPMKHISPDVLQGLKDRWLALLGLQVEEGTDRISRYYVSHQPTKAASKNLTLWDRLKIWLHSKVK